MGRHVSPIEAWRDEYGTLSHALEVKHRAGVDLAVDIADATEAFAPAGPRQLVTVLAGADTEASVGLLTAPRRDGWSLPRRACLGRPAIRKWSSTSSGLS